MTTTTMTTRTTITTTATTSKITTTMTTTKNNKNDNNNRDQGLGNRVKATFGKRPKERRFSLWTSFLSELGEVG